MARSILYLIRNLIRFGRITNVDKDDKAVHRIQVQYFNKTKDVPAIYPYGLSANAPLDSLALIINVGDEENAVAIPFTSDPRPKGLKEGEVAIGDFVNGSIIKFLKNGDIEITGKKNININVNGNAVITASSVSIESNTDINGNLSVSGNITGQNVATSAGKDLGTHTHFVPTAPGESLPPK